MKVDTRYGTKRQTDDMGLLPAIIVGTASGIATYILYRHANGCPDQYDAKQAIEKGAKTIEEFVDMI